MTTLADKYPDLVRIKEECGNTPFAFCMLNYTIIDSKLGDCWIYDAKMCDDEISPCNWNLDQEIVDDA